jgi:amino acid transporter
VGGVALFQLINFTLLVANAGSGMGAQLAAGRLLYGMGRSNALPRRFFGAIDPKSRTPKNNILAVGLFALLGASLLEFFSQRLGGGAYEIGAQAVNFGAFIAFVGVNVAAFVRYWLRAEKKTFGNFLFPVLGATICAFIWAHLGHAAMALGACWMAAGIVYGTIHTHGFRSGPMDFEIAPENDTTR